MNTYKALKDSQVKRLNALTKDCTFAASNYDQFVANCERMHIDPVKPDEVFVLSETRYYNNTTKVYCLKSMESAVAEMLGEFGREFEELYDSDETGDGFITDMLSYYKEANSDSLPPEAIIELCGLTNGLLQSDERLVKAFNNVYPTQDDPVSEEETTEEPEKEPETTALMEVPEESQEARHE